MSPNTSTKDNKADSIVHEARAIGKQQGAVAAKPVVNKFKIADRLNSAIAQIKAAGPVNRSSDLTPLNRDYDLMRKKLRALIQSAKDYSKGRSAYDKSRLEFGFKLATLGADSPLEGPIKTNDSSLTKVYDAASYQSKFDLEKFQDQIIDYVIEWERVVTTRIDADLKEVAKLHERLDHYEGKVGNIRKKVHRNEAEHHDSTGKQHHKGGIISMTKNLTGTSPEQMNAKLDRNESKLDSAWKAYESRASELCYLLEEVTKRGWKDLYHLLKSVMEWESDRAFHDMEAYSRLPAATTSLNKTFDLCNIAPSEMPSQVPVALAATDSETVESEEESPIGHQDDFTSDGSSIYEDDEVVSANVQSTEVIGTTN